MTDALVARFGRWATGWRWTRMDGGPVRESWCCPPHSLTTTAETLPRIADALCEWRAWLEDLAERFDRFPLAGLPAEDGEDAWYAHCEQVLTWFLTRWDVPPERAVKLVEDAIGGRFDSWVAPDPALLRDVAEHLAISVEVDRL